MGKNNWYYQQRKDSQDSDMQFIPRDDVFVKDWFGEGTSRIGNNYQIPADNVRIGPEMDCAARRRGSRGGQSRDGSESRRRCSCPVAA